MVGVGRFELPISGPPALRIRPAMLHPDSLLFQELAQKAKLGVRSLQTTVCKHSKTTAQQGIKPSHLPERCHPTC